jgi:hypothetical protein
MDPIKTKEFQLTQNQYFKILLTLNYKRTRWFILASAVFIIWAFLQNKVADMSNIKISILLLLFVLYSLSPLYTSWRASKNPINSVYMLTRRLIFDGEFITLFKSNGEEAKISLENIPQVKKISDCLMIYTSGVSAIFVPYSAFESGTDLINLENAFKERNLLK